MPEIEDGIVDLILCDLPYGVTQHKDDIPIDLSKLWKEYKRILSSNGLVVLTAQFPFTIDLINSNRRWFRYDLIWDKVLSTGFLNANRMPLRIHEHILIFYKKLPYYCPQKTAGKKNHSIGKTQKHEQNNYGKCGRVDNKDILGNLKHPSSIIRIPKYHASVAQHRTEKPVELAEWIIKSYTKEGDLVLDNCIGTGWTAVACEKNNRRFIGIELKREFVEIARKRINPELEQEKLRTY